jgi:peptidyl-prolyl cis-trans isomerase NIMA-interacting 1
MTRSSSAAAGMMMVVLAATTACDDKPKAAPPAPAETSPSSVPVDAAPAAATTSAAPVPPDVVAAQHVLVAYKGAEKAPKGITRSKAEAKKRAEEVAAKAKEGVDFSALVSEYSDDPAAKERQGSVGKFTREKMAKPFSDAAFALAVGATSDPVETPFGYHVIKRNQ